MRIAQWAVVVAAISVLVAVAAVAYAAGRTQTAPVIEVVRARRFQLVDVAGRVRMDLLMTSPDTPKLVVSGPRGEVGVMLGLSQSGDSSLMLKDANSQCTVLASASSAGPTLFGVKSREIVWGLPKGAATVPE